MGTRYLLGVDVGTQGVKAAIFSTAGAIAGSGFRASRLIQPEPGVTEEVPNEQYRNLCEAIREAIGSGGVDPKAIVGVALDGQMAGVIGIDGGGSPVTPYDSWLDTRCTPYIKRMRDAARDRIATLTGNAPSFNHGPKVLWWKHERPQTYARIARFVQPTGYAALRLTGGDARQAFIDTTYLHFSGFADNVRGEWSTELLSMFDVEADKMPRIVDPTEVVGEVSAAAAHETGLAEGTSVVAGCGDTAASFLAAGAVEPGICVDVSGTASVFAATTAEFLPDTIDGMLGVGNSAAPGLWHPYAYVNGGGMNLEWFKRILGVVRGEELSFDELNERASAVPDAPTLPVFVPHMAGRVSPGDPDMRGAWFGLDWTHEVGHLYRAILEGIALEYGMYIDRLTELDGAQTVTELRNTGGGNSSALWKRIKADALGVDVIDIQDFSGATHGVAMVAGVGVGALDSLVSAGHAWIRTGDVTTPRADRREFYTRRKKQYRAALDAAHRFAQN